MKSIGVALAVCAGVLGNLAVADDGDAQITGRRLGSDAELEYWLRNALQVHRFTSEETGRALDMSPEEVEAACARLGIDPSFREHPLPAGRLNVFPYPGGRHPRIGFLDGAIDPQRETKVSIFTPWQPVDGSRADYVVVDVPEAIWSNLGLTYLAHTHVPTLWTQQEIELERLEWSRHGSGALSIERTLPNGIVFSAAVVPRADHVAMQLTLTNGTEAALTNLRVQNCVLLREAAGFNRQHNENKVSRPPYIAVRHESEDRWIVTGWKPNHRTWANSRCPCLHSDPRFEDCPSGETRVVRGWLSFYEGVDLEGEIERIEGLRWWLEDLGASLQPD